jgi:hypothetical protein
LPDNGFLLDYVSQTSRRVLIQAAGLGWYSFGYDIVWWSYEFIF